MKRLRLLLLRIDLWFNPYKYDEEGKKVLLAFNNPKERVKGMTKQEVVNSDIIALRNSAVNEPIELGSGISHLSNKPYDNGIYFHDVSKERIEIRFNSY